MNPTVWIILGVLAVYILLLIVIPSEDKTVELPKKEPKSIQEILKDITDRSHY